MSTVTTQRMTAEEFWDWAGLPENQDRLYELDRGEVVEMPPPGDVHGSVCSWIAYLLWNFAIRSGKGRVTSNDTGLLVARNPDTVRGPDIMFFGESVPLNQLSRRFSESIPLLVIEVVSPSDRWSEIQRRIDQYLARGIALVWILETQRRLVRVFRPTGYQQTFEENAEVTGEEALPGLRLRVADLFTLPGSADVSRPSGGVESEQKP